MKKYLIALRNIVFFGGLYLFIQMACGQIFSLIYIMSHKKIPMKELIINCQKAIMENIYLVVGVSAIITFVLYFIILRKKENNLIKRCKFHKINLVSILKIVGIAIALSSFSCAMVSLLQSKFKSYSTVSNSIGSAYGSILAMLCLIVLVPIFEEILFRGLIFNELRKVCNKYMALIIQALIFAIFHGNPLQMIYTFALGIVLGTVYMWSDSLWSNIICHITYNLFGTIIIPMALYYTHKFLYLYIGVGAILTVLIMINTFKYYKKQNLCKSV